jgi:homoaconitate hydratase family protein/3-isopropylmalate dehydratase small subunit
MTAGRTIVEKILASHSGADARPGAIVDVAIDVRVARDFGGANVVKNLRGAGLPVGDPKRSFFTFDCNPGGSDQKYAANQQVCREFAREQGVRVFDIDRGIGTHVAIDEGLAVPGSTLVSTDSHANLLGAIGAFGQGMGDLDVAHAFAHGRVWFKVPPTVRVMLRGTPAPEATAKDLTLAVLRKLGASGLLGVAAEFSGEAVDALGLAGRITMASMATEMGAIIALFEPDREVLDWCRRAAGRPVQPVVADPDAGYAGTVEIDVGGVGHLLSRPGHPEDVTDLGDVAGRKIGSAFIGSCTNGRIEDLRAAAEVLSGRRTAPGVVLKIVPATDRVWREALREGLLGVLKEAGALVGNAGCAGCAEGQIGQNGPGEVTVSTGNRNFPGKQGRGEVWLCSPAVAAASAVAGAIAAPGGIPDLPAVFATGTGASVRPPAGAGGAVAERPTRLRGRVILVPRDNVDTDMIFHNRHLAITDLAEMGRHAFGNLPGFTGYAATAKPGDIVIAGGNFGCGSSRQQAVDCFRALGTALLVAKSFGAIYERNAINSGFPILAADLLSAGLADGMEIEVDLVSGEVVVPGGRLRVEPFSPVQLAIYRRGGLLR